MQCCLVGVRQYTSGLEALTSDAYYVSGEIEFSPQEGKAYVVDGNLADDYSSVWIEDEATGLKVTDVIKGNEENTIKIKRSLVSRSRWGRKNRGLTGAANIF